MKYQIYHDTYSAAIEEALESVNQKGFLTDSSETFQIIGVNSKRPQPGETTKVTIPLYNKDRNIIKKALHIQVYNRETETNTFELNCYIA